MLSVSSSEVGEGGQIEEEKWAVRGPKGKIHGRAFQSIPHMWRASVSSFTLWTLFLLLLPVCLLCSAELVLCSRWESSSELCFKQMGGFWSSWERGSLLQMNFGAVHCSVNADGPHRGSRFMHMHKWLSPLVTRSFGVISSFSSLVLKLQSSGSSLSTRTPHSSFSHGPFHVLFCYKSLQLAWSLGSTACCMLSFITLELSQGLRNVVLFFI